MRVSSSYLYGSAASSISERQAQLAKGADQISSGLRILNPADDPVGAARVVELQNAKTGSDQMMSNQVTARNALSQNESLLGNIGDMYTDVRTLRVQAGDAALSDGDRASIAQELEANRPALLAMANSQDADGYYVFGGYAESRAPLRGVSGWCELPGRRGLPQPAGRHFTQHGTHHGRCRPVQLRSLG